MWKKGQQGQAPECRVRQSAVQTEARICAKRILSLVYLKVMTGKLSETVAKDTRRPRQQTPEQTRWRTS